MGADLNDSQRALLDLLLLLDERRYAFTTVTPSSHRRVLDREPEPIAGCLRDLLGWSLPAPDAAFEPDVRGLLERAGMLREQEGRWRSAVRVSTVEGRLFLHSAFPTREQDAVFLGPDTYRFVRFLSDRMQRQRPASLVDVGAGSGVGGILAGRMSGAGRVVLADVNARALALAAVNAAHAGVDVELVKTSGLDGLDSGFDLIVANPPFMNGAGGRTYASGGAVHGAELSLQWARAGARRLSAGGRLLMYSGSAIVRGGRDRMREALEEFADEGFELRYEEIDPDIFGEVLSQRGYAEVERVAAVGIELRRRV